MRPSKCLLTFLFFFLVTFYSKAQNSASTPFLEPGTQYWLKNQSKDALPVKGNFVATTSIYDLENLFGDFQKAFTILKATLLKLPNPPEKISLKSTYLNSVVIYLINCNVECIEASRMSERDTPPISLVSRICTIDNCSLNLIIPSMHSNSRR
jgi:hypothetical protein